jgi:hypothetical protein
MSEKEIFWDAEQRWRSFCRTEGASAAPGSARGMKNLVRSAFVSVDPRPKVYSPGCVMNYPG